MAATDQRPSDLYAAYIELTDERDAAHRRRHQYIVLPQMPARLALGDTPVTNTLCWFEREQRNAKHRAIWRFNRDTGGTFALELSHAVTRFEAAGWTISPMITCEIHPSELGQIIKEQKTPYRIIARLQKVARAMYRLDIS